MGEISRGAARAGGREGRRRIGAKSSSAARRTEDKIIWVKNVANRVSGRRHTSAYKGAKSLKRGSLSRDSFMGLLWLRTVLEALWGDFIQNLEGRQGFFQYNVIIHI